MISEAHVCWEMIALLPLSGPRFFFSPVTPEGGPEALTHLLFRSGVFSCLESQRLESAGLPSGGSNGPPCASAGGGGEGRNGNQLLSPLGRESWEEGC